MALLAPPIHFPYVDAVQTNRDGHYLEQNYIALERHASEHTCKSLHIPYKQWMRVNPDDPMGWQWELANTRAIETWAATLDGCCTGTEDVAFPIAWFVVRGVPFEPVNFITTATAGETSEIYTLDVDADYCAYSFNPSGSAVQESPPPLAADQEVAFEYWDGATWVSLITVTMTHADTFYFVSSGDIPRVRFDAGTQFRVNYISGTTMEVFGYGFTFATELAHDTDISMRWSTDPPPPYV